MEENKATTLPRFQSLDELVEFFDTNDLGDYWDEMPPAHFEIDLKKRRYLFALDDELATQLIQIARERHTSTEVLIHSWLREKIMEYA
jgi:hypothetical protein